MLRILVPAAQEDGLRSGGLTVNRHHRCCGLEQLDALRLVEASTGDVEIRVI